MHVKFYRPARLMSYVLAGHSRICPTALAADTLVEQDVQASVVTEQDAPVVVSNLITKTALGLGTVNVLGVNVRENPTTDAAVVATLAQDQQVVVLSQDGDWYRVSCDGVYGFIHSDYMTVESQGTADLGYGLVKCEAANVRTEANAEADTLSCLSQEDGGHHHRYHRWMVSD